MKCPDCGIEILALPCERCAEEAARWEDEKQELVQEFALIRGAPQTAEAKASLAWALARMQERLDKEQWQHTVSYDSDDLLRSERWWFIPYGWIGCRGFIVDLKDGYVNWLGSALGLRDCFWGHEHGIFCDLVDFTFAAGTDQELATRLLARFKHLPPNASGGLSDQEQVWYRASELGVALANEFPTFRRHFVWYAIPELLQAWKEEGLRFICAPSRGSGAGRVHSIRPDIT